MPSLPLPELYFAHLFSIFHPDALIPIITMWLSSIIYPSAEEGFRVVFLYFYNELIKEKKSKYMFSMYLFP